MMSRGINSFSLNRISAILEAIESQLRRWCKGLKAWQGGEVGESTDQHKFNVLFPLLACVTLMPYTYGLLFFPSISLPLVT